MVTRRMLSRRDVITDVIEPDLLYLFQLTLQCGLLPKEDKFQGELQSLLTLKGLTWPRYRLVRLGGTEVIAMQDLKLMNPMQHQW